MARAIIYGKLFVERLDQYIERGIINPLVGVALESAVVQIQRLPDFQDAIITRNKRSFRLKWCRFDDGALVGLGVVYQLTDDGAVVLEDLIAAP